MVVRSLDKFVFKFFVLFPQSSLEALEIGQSFFLVFEHRLKGTSVEYLD